VSENRALKRTFGPKRDKIRWECRKLHKEELNDLYSPNISRMITSRRTRWGGEGVHIASMGERRGVYRVLVGWGNLKSTTVLGAIIFLHCCPLGLTIRNV